jgi:hypothetical protein
LPEHQFLIDVKSALCSFSFAVSGVRPLWARKQGKGTFRGLGGTLFPSPFIFTVVHKYLLLHFTPLKLVSMPRFPKEENAGSNFLA